MARLAEDNNFGARTQAMVREFQRLNGITTDGIVGRSTSLSAHAVHRLHNSSGGDGALARHVALRARPRPRVNGALPAAEDGDALPGAGG